MRRVGVLAAVLLLLSACSADPGGEGMASPAASSTIRVTSTAFGEGATIPEQFTCRGAGTSPDLRWEGVPSEAKTLALVVTDPDAPRGTFLHLLAFGFSPDVDSVASGAVPAGAEVAVNSANKTGWVPPCPPSGTHRYYFTVYALDGQPAGGDSRQLQEWIAAHTIAAGSLMGRVSAQPAGA